ncbi:MAG: hypothetical protein ACRENO_09535 [Thermodesulfobacteriota bacterium]
MKNSIQNAVLIICFLLILPSCASKLNEENVEVKEKNKETVEYINSYNKVWDAALTSANELNWKIEAADKKTGVIKFEESYVYSPSAQKYTRIHNLPSKSQAESSNVTPYLLKVAGLNESDVKNSFNFAKENLNIKLIEMQSSSKTGVNIDYRISGADSMSNYQDLKSSGNFEKNLYSRIETILSGIEEVKIAPERDIFTPGIPLYDIFLIITVLK